MLAFLKDIFLPAKPASRPEVADPNYDPWLGYSWHRSDPPDGLGGRQVRGLHPEPPRPAARGIVRGGGRG